MLNFLQIRNFAIVESLDLEFSAGFTAITGETGAGKSILVDAVGLLRGNRADTSAIRDGAEKAELSAEFELEDGSKALAWLRDTELDNANSCLLRRLINENGRSRAWINGTAVTLQQLAELGDLLVEIHGQNEHIRLLGSEEQFRLLDGSGKYAAKIHDVATSHRSWEQLEQEKQALLDESPLSEGDRELLQYQLRELESALLSPTEFEALETTHRRMARGSEIIAGLEFALSCLEGENNSISTKLHAAIDRLNEYASLDQEIDDAVRLLGVASINCEEARNSIQGTLSGMDLSAERLAEMERKLSEQYDLARKHRAEPGHLVQVLDKLRQRLDRAGSLEQRLAAIEPELAQSLQNYRTVAEKLHQARASRAALLSDAVTTLMQELGMTGGCFKFTVHHKPDSPPSVRGDDRLELLVSANPGIAPGPLRKVASGGELSRISLAIKVASKSDETSLTQIFDEVDAGIGGDTANAVGALLGSLSTRGQALCVTHLAQVAVCADHQMQVQKSAKNKQTQVKTRLLVKDERVDEIARMLGGHLSEQSRAHASELLATAQMRH